MARSGGGPGSCTQPGPLGPASALAKRLRTTRTSSREVAPGVGAAPTAQGFGVLVASTEHARVQEWYRHRESHPDDPYGSEVLSLVCLLFPPWRRGSGELGGTCTHRWTFARWLLKPVPMLFRLRARVAERTGIAPATQFSPGARLPTGFLVYSVPLRSKGISILRLLALTSSTLAGYVARGDRLPVPAGVQPAADAESGGRSGTCTLLVRRRAVYSRTRFYLRSTLPEMVPRPGLAPGPFRTRT